MATRKQRRRQRKTGDATPSLNALLRRLAAEHGFEDYLELVRDRALQAWGEQHGPARLVASSVSAFGTTDVTQIALIGALAALYMQMCDARERGDWEAIDSLANELQLQVEALEQERLKTKR